MDPRWFSGWVREFRAADGRRREEGDPDWTRGAAGLSPAVVRSLQRFQVGESGDGANLIRAAERTGDADYAEAVRLFVAEERDHARLLARLLRAADAPTITRHWTDTAFVAVRRALGLRLELMTLLVAEVIALRYYRALRDGAGDRLTTQVADRVLTDEERHVPFHVQRLHADYGHLSPALWSAVRGAWWALYLAAVAVVAVDHGSALARLGVPRRRFAADAIRLFARTVRDVRRGLPVPACSPG
ncbi:hypothetical protein B0I33_11352 [Prauserella shujinwangii]|uniref:Ferritin-like domain-containing protein n=1 Tax=Prauserella shujinwangii TaxID=1453103 RepID=A0A2T0LLH4_9PSEU|nr:ferritin-like domain-containing protein [Prauserella shujinwangii]PRX43889.1 hypothetical protein B0I33_11352 [Prauserella shujinwangii]